jgi:YD repeat-containing protein
MIMAIVEGRAYLDVDGDGNDDGPSVLAPLGITTTEREALGSLFGVGQKLWRVEVDHFTPWDHNHPLIPGASPITLPAGPKLPPPSSWQPTQGCTTGCGSIIEIEDQKLGERVGITGTPFFLAYTSRRAPAFRPAYGLTATLTGNSQPDKVTRIEVTISAAGKSVTHVTDPAPNQKLDFTWDGRDAYGRIVQGGINASVTVTYFYEASYLLVDFNRYTFADASRALREGSIPALPPLRATTPGQAVSWSVPLGNWQSTGSDVGGWTLSAHRTYDPASKVLYAGDGSQRTAEGIGPVVETVAGNGECCDSAGDGGPALAAALDSPRALAVAPDGSILVAERQRVRKIGRDGIITTIAGNGTSPQQEQDHDGLSDGPARSVPVAPRDIATDANGALYLTEGSRVRKLSDGRLNTIGGNGQAGRDGDDGPATSARMNPIALAAARDGSVLVVDADETLSRRLRRISTAGRVRAIAGGGSGGNGEPAVAASIGKTMGVAVGPSGNIYLSDVGRGETRRITPAGIIDRYGPSDGSFSTDFIGDAAAIAVDEEEKVYFGTTVTGTNGDSSLFLGGGSEPGDGVLARASSISQVRDVAVSPDGIRYIIDQGRVKRVFATMPGLGLGEIALPSPGGDEIYIFDPAGRHLRTEDAVTGVLLYRFEYDGAGRLTAVIDVDENRTTIERDANGQPRAIVAPGGQRSDLAIDATGYLEEISNPAGQGTTFAYWSGGLLRRFTDPNQNASAFTYDPTGLLIKDEDAAGGHTMLNRSGNNTSYAVSTTSAEGRVRSYTVSNGVDRSVQRTSTDASGLTASSASDGKGGTNANTPAGMEMSQIERPDVRFGMQAPVGSAFVRTPSGLQMFVEATRTVQHSNPSNPGSEVVRVESKSNINGRESVSTFHRPSRTLTTTSPMGRTSSAVFDASDHLQSLTVPGITPAGFVYDGRGRLTGVSQGSRTTMFGYDARNRLTTTTDPLGRTVGFNYDDADRVMRQTLADGRFIGFTYDAKGNVTAITPPSRPQHSFTMTPVDLPASYAPPAVANGGPTLYDYNRDRQLTLVTRPDSKTIRFGYDGGGRLASLTIGRGAYTFGYETTSGQIRSVETPDGDRITYGYDGSLLTQATWTGAVTASIAGSTTTAFGSRPKPCRASQRPWPANRSHSPMTTTIF